MVFDDKPLDEISDDEINALVQDHVQEQQHLELKATYEHEDGDKRQEMLRDIVSMANGGGGYLVIGVHEDGQGRAGCFVEPRLMSAADRMQESIFGLCRDHIAERIEGIEIRTRDVNGHKVILVRIPRSGRRPHMVTRNHRTDFVTRVETAKRTMSLTEIREAFVKEENGLRLASIQATLNDVAQIVRGDQQEKDLAASPRADVSDELLLLDDGSRLAKLCRQYFRTEVGEDPFLWLALTPVSPKARLVDVEEADIVAMLSNPPGSRRGGWGMPRLSGRRQRTLTGVELGTKSFRFLEVFENGHLEFWTPLTEHFCWNQSEEERRKRPRLYPYPVVEFPVTFLRLGSALLKAAGYSQDVLVQLEYRNVANYILRPGRPGSMAFQFSSGSSPSNGPHIPLAPRRRCSDFDPDEVALDLLRKVYGAFGFEPGDIPFQDPRGGFSFGDDRTG